MPNSYPIAKGILLRFPNGGYQSIGGIFVEAKSQEQRNQIVQELDDSMGFLSAMLATCKGQKSCQEILDNFCSTIEKDHGVICRAVTGQGFLVFQYITTNRIYKEGVPYA